VGVPDPTWKTLAVMMEYWGTEIVPVRIPGTPLFAETLDVLVLVIWGLVL